MDEMEELKQEFLSEAEELLILMEEEILELEQDSTKTDSINSIFRVAHTLKGAAAALDLTRISVFTHNLENMLDLVRDNSLTVDEDFINITLSSLDILKALVLAASQNIEAEKNIEDEILQQIIHKIKPENSISTEQSEHAFADDHSLSDQHSEELPYFEDEAFDTYLSQEFSLEMDEVEEFRNTLLPEEKIYIVNIHLDPENKMRSVSGVQTITALKNIGRIVEGVPSVSEIIEEEFVEYFKFLFVSSQTGGRIYSKVHLSDVTLIVNVQEIKTRLKEEQEENTDSQNPENQSSNTQNILDTHQFVLSQEMQATIQKLLKEEKRIYQIRIWIDEESLMKDVDSLLILTTLETIGNIIDATPSKRDLQGDTYYPILNIFLESDKTKQEIKDICFIDDTTLEIRVGEFKLKSNKESQSQKATNIFQDQEEKKLTKPSQANGANELDRQENKRDKPLNEMSSTKKLPEIKEGIQYPSQNEGQKLGDDSETPDLQKEFSSKLMSSEELRVKKKGNVYTENGKKHAKTFLKVDSARVDILLNLVSELVISKAALVEMSSTTINEMNKFEASSSSVYDILWDVAGRQTEEDSFKLKKVNQYLVEINHFLKKVDFFENIVNSVSRSINELQTGIMRIRMVSMGSVFNRFTRVVRDASKQLNKKVVLKITGEETELDKSIIEELADPLMHMVRNSIDHGIEMPQERIANGKPEEGVVSLHAMHEGDVIKIEVIDDGKGLDPDRILAKAIENGLVNPEQKITTDEIYQLILLPGFSTSEEVTELSGRGVGMDVVKRNIEKISGTIQIQSELGKGSTMTIRIPLTLSIIQALIVKIKGFSYAFPLNMVLETIPFKREDVSFFDRSEVVYLNNEMVVVIDIKKIFNLKSSKEELDAKANNIDLDMNTDLLDESLEIIDKIFAKGSQKNENREHGWFFSNLESSNSKVKIQEKKVQEEFLVITQVGNKRVGFLVDNIISEQDIVIKPLDKSYGLVEGVSGAAILGEGSISLILNVFQLIELYAKKDNFI